MTTEFSPKRCPCGCPNWIMEPYFGCQCSSVSAATRDELVAMARDAARYRWFRDGPVGRGRAELDALCDDGIKAEADRRFGQPHHGHGREG